jgi:hypothetical protein
LQPGRGANLSLMNVLAGNHTLKVRATDVLGDFSEDTATFRVREKPSPPPVPPVEVVSGLPAPLFLAAAASVVIVCVAVLVVLSRRAKR